MEWPREWSLAGATPLDAAHNIDKRVGRPDICSQRYMAFRSRTRSELSDIYKSVWSGTRTRLFSSAVVIELANLWGVTLTEIPVWADEDMQKYNDLCTRQGRDPQISTTQPEDLGFQPGKRTPIPIVSPALYGEVSVKIDASEAIAAITHYKEEIMSLKQTQSKLIETRIFINGVDAATLTDDQIFQAIGQAEHQIKELEMIENKPEKLGKKISKLYKAIEKVKAYVDGR